VYSGACGTIWASNRRSGRVETVQFCFDGAAQIVHSAVDDGSPHAGAISDVELEALTR